MYQTTPPSILKNIPKSINKRLSETSSDKECFDNAKNIYQDALDKNDYTYKLFYKGKNIAIVSSPCSWELGVRVFQRLLLVVSLR